LIWVVGHCEQVEMSTLEKKCHHQGHQFKNNLVVLLRHVDPSCFEIRFIKAIFTTEVLDHSHTEADSPVACFWNPETYIAPFSPTNH
jgi:hypothetical protein